MAKIAWSYRTLQRNSRLHFAWLKREVMLFVPIRSSAHFRATMIELHTSTFVTLHVTGIDAISQMHPKLLSDP